MIIYLHGSPGKTPTAEHTLFVCPAGHLPKEFDGANWYDDTGEKRMARTYEVKFHYGEASVPDPLGKYLVATGQALKNRLVIANSWNL